MAQTAVPAAELPVSTMSKRAPQVHRKGRDALVAYLFLAPALSVFLAFLAVPLALTIGLSFVDWSGITLNSMKWAGLLNYTRIFHDALFWQSLKNNMIFLALGMTLIVALGLFVAVLLEQGFPGSKFFRGVFFVPTVLSLVVVGIVFSFLLDPTFGVLKPMLNGIGIQGSPAPLADGGLVRLCC